MILELKKWQLTIVKHAVEVYLATVTEDYDRSPTTDNLKRVVEVTAVLDLFNGKQREKK